MMRGKIIRWGKALGDSMLPLLSPGVKLLIIQTDFNNAKIGDILCFRKQGYVVHRLIGKSQLKNTFTTKGDNSVTIDNPFTEKELIGKVQKIIYSDNKVIDLDSTIAGVVNYLLAQLLSKIYPLLRTQYRTSNSNLKQFALLGWSSVLRALTAM